MQKPEHTPDKRLKVILLADDDPACLDIGMKMLRKLGYHVLKASDGKEAVAVYLKNMAAVDLVILDMRMPFNGCTAFERLKQIKADVRVLIASGYAEDQRVREILAQGGIGFLPKPFSIVELSQSVRRALGR